MGMNLHVYVGPYVKCLKRTEEADKVDILDVINERLFEATQEWDQSYDAWLPNIRYGYEGHTYDKWSETQPADISRESVTTALRLFKESFGKEVEDLRKYYEVVTVGFGAIPYYM